MTQHNHYFEDTCDEKCPRYRELNAWTVVVMRKPQNGDLRKAKDGNTVDVYLGPNAFGPAGWYEIGAARSE